MKTLSLLKMVYMHSVCTSCSTDSLPCEALRKGTVPRVCHCLPGACLPHGVYKPPRTFLTLLALALILLYSLCLILLVSPLLRPRVKRRAHLLCAIGNAAALPRAPGQNVLSFVNDLLLLHCADKLTADKLTGDVCTVLGTHSLLRACNISGATDRNCGRHHSLHTVTDE